MTEKVYACPEHGDDCPYVADFCPAMSEDHLEFSTEPLDEEE